MHTKKLIDQFARADLELEAAHEPFASNADIFQMDIRRHNRRNAHSEYFAMWRGHDSNHVEVHGLDRFHHQLVMMVREPEREFFDPIPPFRMKHHGWAHQVAADAKVSLDDIVVTRGRGFVRRMTTSTKRHFLVGRDERQLFMCRLPNACTSVREAHEALRPPEVKDDAIRQGEWFFLTPPQEELNKLKHDLAKQRIWPRLKVSIGSVIIRRGKPHVADELVVRDQKVYVRGAVRHDDHKTIRLYEWREVVRNREVTEVAPLFGGTWID
jgi:hypothetical protein